MGPRTTNLRHVASSSDAYLGAGNGSVRIDEFEIPPGFRMRNHGHAGAHLCYLVAGSFEERVPRGSHLCTPRTLRHSPPGDKHDMTIGQSGALCLLLSSEDEEAPRPDGRVFLEEPRLALLAQRLHAELSFGSDASPLILEGVALELFAQSSRSVKKRAQRPPLWTRQLRDRLHDSYSEPLGLDALAAEVGRHPMHAARAFREHYGSSIGDYVRRLQIDAARRRITMTDEPLAMVAASVGFTDQSHMNRLFRRTLGCTPGHLRRMATN